VHSIDVPTSDYLRCVRGKGQLQSVKRSLTHRETLVSATVDCLWCLVDPRLHKPNNRSVAIVR
jgi:hypothetical protein